MKIQRSRIARTLVLEIDGELDIDSAPVLRSVVDSEIVRRRTIRNVVLNMGRVTFIDSSGVGVILGCYKKSTQLGGKLVLSQVASQVQRVLDVSGILKLVPVFESEYEAMASLGGDLER